MKLLDVLAMCGTKVSPSEAKLHLATWNGDQNPLDEYLAGNFEAWQSWQSKKNFERPYIISLIKLAEPHTWLFAGCYRRLDRAWVEDPQPAHWVYQTEEVEKAVPLSGRLILYFQRSGRASYLNAERWASKLEVRQLLDQRISLGEFPGYHRLLLTRSNLMLIAERERAWREALSAVAGVYLITDTQTGRLYVGSATGAGGIWARWQEYVANGHGGNVELRKLLKREGQNYVQHFQYAVLEIADTHASNDDVLARESHWKRVLGCRDHGYNGN